jgi:hypothetical protein
MSAYERTVHIISDRRIVYVDDIGSSSERTVHVE